MIPNKSSLFSKIPTFLVENKHFFQNFVIAFEKMCFWPGSGSGIQILKYGVRYSLLLHLPRREFQIHARIYIINNIFSLDICPNVLFVFLQVPGKKSSGQISQGLPALLSAARFIRSFRLIMSCKQISVLLAGNRNPSIIPTVLRRCQFQRR